MPRPERGVGQGTFCMPCSRGSLGGLGSTLFFLGFDMTRPDLPPLPLPQDKWQQIVSQLKLSPKQMRVVELILRNRCDKQIETELGLPHATLRTHLERTFHKAKVCDRRELVILIFAMSHGLRPP
jgi:DNA-binding CsgD family transcriptional regulator